MLAPLLWWPDFHFTLENVMLGIGFSIPSLTADYGVGNVDLLVSPVVERFCGFEAKEISQIR